VFFHLAAVIKMRLVDKMPGRRRRTSAGDGIAVPVLRPCLAVSGFVLMKKVRPQLKAIDSYFVDCESGESENVMLAMW
jgi:hypothetical protein